MNKILVMVIIFLMISPIFAQRGTGRGRRRSNALSSMQINKAVDPNETGDFVKDLPVLPEKRNDYRPQSEKTLEERIVELEEEVAILKKDRDELIIDNMLLEMNLKNYISYMINGPELARREEAEARKNMTQQEIDVSIGIYPMLPNYEIVAK